MIRQETQINGVEFECRGEWVREGARLRITTVPELTAAGRKRIQDSGWRLRGPRRCDRRGSGRSDRAALRREGSGERALEWQAEGRQTRAVIAGEIIAAIVIGMLLPLWPVLVAVPTW